MQRTNSKLSLLTARYIYSAVEAWAFLLSRYGAILIVAAELFCFLLIGGFKLFTLIAIVSAALTLVVRTVWVFFRPGLCPFGEHDDKTLITFDDIWNWHPSDRDLFDSGAWNVLRQMVATIIKLRRVGVKQHGIGALLAMPSLQGHELAARLYYMYSLHSVQPCSSLCGDTEQDPKEESKDDEMVIKEAMAGFKYYRPLCVYTYEMSNEVKLASALKKKGYALVACRFTANLIPAGCPAYFLAHNVKRKEVVLCVRGTKAPQDVILDLLLSGKEVEYGLEGYVHQGMSDSAQFLLNKFEGTLASLHDTGNSIVLVGHSLGAGVASLMALHLGLLRSKKLERLKCWAFCPPPCMDLHLAQACAPFITSLIINNDVVTRLGGGPFSVLLRRLSEFDWQTAAQQQGVPKSLTVIKHLDAIILKPIRFTARKLRRKKKKRSSSLKKQGSKGSRDNSKVMSRATSKVHSGRNSWGTTIELTKTLDIIATTTTTATVSCTDSAVEDSTATVTMDSSMDVTSSTQVTESALTSDDIHDSADSVNFAPKFYLDEVEQIVEKLEESEVALYDPFTPGLIVHIKYVTKCPNKEGPGPAEGAGDSSLLEKFNHYEYEQLEDDQIEIKLIQANSPVLRCMPLTPSMVIDHSITTDRVIDALAKF